MDPDPNSDAQQRDDDFVTTEVVVGSAVGLHARPAAQFVKAAKARTCEVRLGRPGGDLVDAKSILKVLGLGAGPSETIVLAARGEGADDALRELGELVARPDS